ncbi:DUF2974 domain-containing protein [Altererythrobacter luteolus]|uniref:DUF2974 domain-containing protein n=1 Tax=Pontixanthobacter luteolus TaxID=295089 RepID=A0A6I4V1P9_9SPHN|nr:DUF2974 domain-containing protein [Pontixanthobacter luteolus]MXP48219.1 DUF2974 domain-containing protein [Pontixanthobacter luteolus]
MLRALYLAVLAALLTSCVSTSKVRLTGLDHPSGWSDQIRTTANSSFLYAQLSFVSYQGPPEFQIDSKVSEVERQENNSIDFAYAIFSREMDVGPSEIIIAFRGTDTARDVWSGTLTNAQGAAGLELFDRIRSEFLEERIIVTGHSQGGAIATHVTLNRENVTGYFFNTSPRFRRLSGDLENDRYSIVEHGDPLKLLRLFGREPTQLYTSIGCTRGGPFSQHSARSLAICLTQIASWEREAARTSLRRNNLSLPQGVTR